MLFLFASKIDEYDLNVWYCTELEAELDIKNEEGKCLKKEIRKAPFLWQKWGNQSSLFNEMDNQKDSLWSRERIGCYWFLMLIKVIPSGVYKV